MDPFGASVFQKWSSQKKKKHLVQKNWNRKTCMCQTQGSFQDCRGHQEWYNPMRQSCSSESGLSWLQMGQLGDDEKLWVCRPKLCLCIWLDILWDKRTPAIQFYIRVNTQHLQKLESRRDFARHCWKKYSKPESWYTISNQVWEVYWM